MVIEYHVLLIKNHLSGEKTFETKKMYFKPSYSVKCTLNGYSVNVKNKCVYWQKYTKNINKYNIYEISFKHHVSHILKSNNRISWFCI